MKRYIRLISLLCFAVLLCGCTAAVPSQNELPPRENPITPVAEAPDALRTDAEVMLYFRYADQPYLAQEVRTVTQLPSQAWEQTLINALLSGPETHSSRLTPLFPEGTRLISTSREGRTLFVTFSDEIMNGYSDEPASWQNDARLAQEIPLRRKLCMQSLVATVTENSDIDRVQVFVEQSAAASSQRLPQAYFKTTESDTPAPPLTRDGSVLLTPDNTVQAMIRAWLTQDWSTLYCYLPEDGSHLDLRSFTDTMEALPRLIDCTASSGSISADGQPASFALSATVADGQSSRTESGMLRLTRSGAVWCATLPQLTGWLEE